MPVRVHEYAHDPAAESYGLEAAELLASVGLRVRGFTDDAANGVDHPAQVGHQAHE